LLPSETTEKVFYLSLMLPESNIREGNAIAHSMFCLNPDRSFSISLLTLGDLSADMYGYILCKPHEGTNVNLFYAL
jgi:hypothetical protein